MSLSSRETNTFIKIEKTTVWEWVELKERVLASQGSIAPIEILVESNNCRGCLSTHILSNRATNYWVNLTLIVNNIGDLHVS